RSTFSLSAQAWQISVIAVLAPGTQWSQSAMVRLPAAPAVCTNGAATVVAVAAAEVAMNWRRVNDFFLEFAMGISSLCGIRVLAGRPCRPLPDRAPGRAGCTVQGRRATDFVPDQPCQTTPSRNRAATTTAALPAAMASCL